MVRNDGSANAAFVFLGRKASSEADEIVIRFRKMAGDPIEERVIEATPFRSWFRIVIGRDRVYLYEAGNVNAHHPGTWSPLGMLPIDLSGGEPWEIKNDLAGIFLEDGEMDYGTLIQTSDLIWKELESDLTNAEVTGGWTTVSPSGGQESISGQLVSHPVQSSTPRSYVAFEMTTSTPSDYEAYLHLPSGNPTELTAEIWQAGQGITTSISAMPTENGWYYAGAAKLLAGDFEVRLYADGSTAGTVYADAATAVTRAATYSTAAYPHWVEVPASRVTGLNDGMSSNYVYKHKLGKNNRGNEVTRWDAAAYSAEVLVGDGEYFMRIADNEKIGSGGLSTTASGQSPGYVSYRFDQDVNGKVKPYIHGVGTHSPLNNTPSTIFWVRRVGEYISLWKGDQFMGHTTAGSTAQLFMRMAGYDKNFRVVGSGVRGRFVHYSRSNDLDADNALDKGDYETSFFESWVIDADPEDDIQSIYDVSNSAGENDPDGDGLSNLEEWDLAATIGESTNPTMADTDGDGVGDYEEVNTYNTDPTNADSDNDGLLDGLEIESSWGFSATSGDSDSDGVGDFTEWEILNEVFLHGNPHSYELNSQEHVDGGEDFDGDGVSNRDESDDGTSAIDPEDYFFPFWFEGLGETVHSDFGETVNQNGANFGWIQRVVYLGEFEVAGGFCHHHLRDGSRVRFQFSSVDHEAAVGISHFDFVEDLPQPGDEPLHSISIETTGSGLATVMSGGSPVLIGDPANNQTEFTVTSSDLFEMALEMNAEAQNITVLKNHEVICEVPLTWVDLGEYPMLVVVSLPENGDPASSVGSAIENGRYRKVIDPDAEDGDGLPDAWERMILEENPQYESVEDVVGDMDDDDDGLLNSYEYENRLWGHLKDSDGDLLWDGWELEYGLNPRVQDDTTTDLDHDGLTLFEEFQNGTNPDAAHTDEDGIDDGLEVLLGRDPTVSEWSPTAEDPNGVSDLNDFDGDHLSDFWEVKYGLDPTDPNDALRDPDYDRVSNLEEFALGTSPVPQHSWESIYDVDRPAFESKRFGEIPSIVGGLNKLGQLCDLESAGDRFVARIWDQGVWGEDMDFGPIEGFSTVVAVRLNSFGLVAAALRREVGAPGDPSYEVSYEVRIRDTDGALQRFGTSDSWGNLLDLSVTDSGFVTAAVYEDPGQAEVLFRWRAGVSTLISPPAGEAYRLGGSERGEMITSSSLRKGDAWESISGEEPIALGPYGALWTVATPEIDPLTRLYLLNRENVTLESSLAGDLVYGQVPNGGQVTIMSDDGSLVIGDPGDGVPTGDMIAVGLNGRSDAFGWRYNQDSGGLGYRTDAFVWDGEVEIVSRQDHSRAYQLTETGHLLVSSYALVSGVPDSHAWEMRVPYVDSDGDGMADDWELYHGVSSPDGDTDFDGLSNRHEFSFGTSPKAADTDADGIPDLLEIRNGSDPLVESQSPNEDFDSDGLNWREEFQRGTDPFLADTDSNGATDDLEPILWETVEDYVFASMVQTGEEGFVQAVTINSSTGDPNLVFASRSGDEELPGWNIINLGACFDSRFEAQDNGDSVLVGSSGWGHRQKWDGISYFYRSGDAEDMFLIEGGVPVFYSECDEAASAGFAIRSGLRGDAAMAAVQSTKGGDLQVVYRIEEGEECETISVGSSDQFSALRLLRLSGQVLCFGKNLTGDWLLLEAVELPVGDHLYGGGFTSTGGDRRVEGRAKFSNLDVRVGVLEVDEVLKEYHVLSEDPGLGTGLSFEQVKTDENSNSFSIPAWLKRCRIYLRDIPTESSPLDVDVVHYDPSEIQVTTSLTVPAPSNGIGVVELGEFVIASDEEFVVFSGVSCPVVVVVEDNISPVAGTSSTLGEMKGYHSDLFGIDDLSEYSGSFDTDGDGFSNSLETGNVDPGEELTVQVTVWYDNGMGEMVSTVIDEPITLDPHDYDTDNDYIPDAIDHDTEQALIENNGLSDSDLDGLSLGVEFVYGTDPGLWDTDGDLISDYREIVVYGTDPTDASSFPASLFREDEQKTYSTSVDWNNGDEDSLDDLWELEYFGDPLAFGNTDDPDMDGVSNEEEFLAGTNPTLPDSDGDGFSDRLELDAGSDPSDDTSLPVDSDLDGLADQWEIEWFGDLSQTGSGYSDNDTLDNETEQALGTNPLLEDTDEDGFDDDYEINNQFDPRDPDDSPVDNDLDGLDSVLEATLNTSDDEIDSDGDGENDGYEWVNGTAPDDLNSLTAAPTGFPPPADSDGDGMLDDWEDLYGLDPLDPTDALLDLDEDGVVNLREHILELNPELPDTDGDEFGDGLEILWGGVWDPAIDNRTATDNDEDGLPDWWESAFGYGPKYVFVGSGEFDNNGYEIGYSEWRHTDPVHPFEHDFDQDGLTNTQEFAAGTSPVDPDTDDDGLTDYEEVTGYDDNGTTVTSNPIGIVDPAAGSTLDADGDTIPDLWEVHLGLAPGNPSDAILDTSDDDGLTNYLEYRHRTGLNDPDSDNDGYLDGEEVVIGMDPNTPQEVDDDNDGMPDAWEVYYSLNPYFPGDVEGDPDRDGLKNRDEYLLHTNPLVPDSDGDGLTDGEEVDVYLTSPTSTDFDGDGIEDGDEVNVYGTDPSLANAVPDEDDFLDPLSVYGSSWGSGSMEPDDLQMIEVEFPDEDPDGSGDPGPDPDDPPSDDPEPLYPRPSGVLSGNEHRKIALDGSIVRPNNPEDEPETDRVREETYVDAFDLRLHHSTSDVYVSFPGSQLSLEVSRNNVADEPWGDSPGKTMRKPFGWGWNSNISVYIRVQQSINSDGFVDYQIAEVSDENGQKSSYENKYGTWYPLPGAGSSPASILDRISFGNGYATLVKPFGTSIHFSKISYEKAFPVHWDRTDDRTVFEYPIDRLPTARQQVLYYRATFVQDQNGNRLEYEYPGAETLVPSKIIDPDRDTYLSIAQDSDGRVMAIMDPEGNITRYSYTNYSTQRPFWFLTSVIRPDRSRIRYKYDWVFSDLESIEDQYGNVYEIEYGNGIDYHYFNPETGIYDWGYPAGKPYDWSGTTGMCVKSVNGPRGTARFHQKSEIWFGHTTEDHVPLDDFKAKTVVTDVEKNSLTYVFEDPKVYDLDVAPGKEFDPDSKSVAIGYRKMSIYTGGDFGKLTSELDDILDGLDGVEGLEGFGGLNRIYGALDMMENQLDTVGDQLLGMDGLGALGIGREEYEFEPSAGFALKRARDFSGNETHYVYGVGAPSFGFRGLLAQGLYMYIPEPVLKIEPSGITSYSYVGRRLLFETRGSRFYRYSRDQRGNVVATDVIDPSQGLTERTINTIDSLGFTTRTRVIDFENGNDLITDYITGAARRPVQTIQDPDGLALTTNTTYDANGNKLTETDPLGNTTTFEYDKFNRIKRIEKPAFSPPAMTGEGTDSEVVRSWQEIDREPSEYGGERTVTSTYETTIVDEVETTELVSRQIVERDGGRRIAQEGTDINLDGALDRGVDIVSDYVFDGLGNLDAMTDPRGYVTEYEYDSLNRKTKEIQAVGTTEEVVTTYEYDRSHDGWGGLSTTDEPNVGGLMTGFHPLTAITDKAIVHNVYDDAYRLTESHVDYDLDDGANPLASTFTTYDMYGNPIRQIDPSGLITETKYDAVDRPLQVTVGVGLADAQVTSTRYSTTGLAVEQTDMFGFVTTTEYDGAGRAVKVTSPKLRETSSTSAPYVLDDQDNEQQAITLTAYDDAGNAISVTDPRGNITETIYDTRNRPIITKAPSVEVDGVAGTGVHAYTRTFYDGRDNVVKTVDPEGAVTTTEYDAAGRATDVYGAAVPVFTGVDGSGNVTTTTATTHVHTTYDPNGNALTVTDPNGNTVTNTYDALNRLKTTTQTDEPGNFIVTQFAYDTNGNRTQVIDGEGQTTLFEYDGLNRNTKIDYPTGVQDLENKYDAAHLTQRIDGNGVTDYAYDDFNRLETVTYDNGATRDYTYDKAGRILTVTESGDARANVAYTYDSWGRQSSETSHGVTHTYTYDVVGNRTKVQYGLTDQVIESSYDARNRLTFLTENNRTTQYGYDRAGRVTRKYLANGQLVKSTYDAQGRRTSTTTHGPGTMGSEGPIIYQQDYWHDESGNLIYQKEQIEDFTTPGTFRTRTVFNEYDTIYRLQAETITDDGSLSLTEYDYDDANNRTARRKDTNGDGTDDETAIYDYTGGWNQLQTYTETSGGISKTVTFGYDANGNRTSRSEDGAITHTYAWDKENRLTGVTQGANSYAYAYDYRTRRIVRDESAGVDNQGNPGVSTSLVFSGGTSNQEWESGQLTSALSAGTISGTARPDVTYVRGSDWGGGVGGVLYTLRADTGTTSYSAGFNFYNSRGDVIAKTDDTGDFTWQGEYRADGQRTHEIGENKDRQRGNTKDEDPTGLLCEGFRYRDLETGSWLSRDPAGFVDGPNLYCYVNQNPWTKFDPLGLQTPTKRNKADMPLTLDHVQNYLSAAGMTPALGIVPDAANTGISLLRGNLGDAGLNAAAMIPIGGQFVTGGRYVDEVVEHILKQSDEALDDALNVSVRELKVSQADAMRDMADEVDFSDAPALSKSAKQKGDEGVEFSREATEAQGNTVVGGEITFELLSGNTTRQDTLVRTPAGKLKTIESKNGPKAKESNRQIEYAEAQKAGEPVIPRGANAEAAGLTPGKPVKVDEHQVDHWNKEGFEK